MASAGSALTEWYRNIISRRVELVGDYAGNELYIIEGDSLLLQCFSDPRIDFTVGYQLLHAVYVVEKLLRDLKSRKCNFHVVFFDDHAELCVPPTCPPKRREKYLLARWAVIRHLKCNLGAESGIELKQFEGYTDPSFGEYLNDAGVYFAMCHDGAFAKADEETADRLEAEKDEDVSSDESESSDEESSDSDSDAEGTSAAQNSQKSQTNGQDANSSDGDSDDSDETSEDEHETVVDTSQSGDGDVDGQTDIESTLVGDIEEWKLDETPLKSSAWRKRAFRGMIYWFISKGYNVALINDVEFRDTKVFSLVLEGSRRKVVRVPDEVHRMLTESREEKISMSFPPAVDALLEQLRTSKQDLDDRDIIGLAAVVGLLQSQEIGPEQAALIILSLAAIKEAPLAQRTFTGSGFQGRDRMVRKIVQTAFQLVQYTPVQSLLESASCAAADLLDGRLLMCITGYHAKAFLENEAVNEHFSALISIVQNTLRTKLAISDSKAKAPKPTKPTVQSTAVLPFINEVFNKHLAPVRLEIEQSEPELNATQRIVFRELSHWHNSKRLIGRKGEPEKANKWALKRNQRFMAEMITYAASLTNASGKVLDPETIVAGAQTVAKKDSTPTKQKGLKPTKEKEAIVKDKPTKGKKPGQGSKPSNKELALQAAAAIAGAKSSTKAANALKTWDSTRKELEAQTTPEVRYIRTIQYYDSLSSDMLAIFGAEVALFAIKALADAWKVACEAGDRQDHRGDLAANIWRWCLYLQQSVGGLTQSMITDLQALLAQLKLPTLVIEPTSTETRRLPFSMQLTATVVKSKSKDAGKTSGDFSIGLPSKPFQLLHCGPYFDRTIDAQADARVPFQPDAWQRKVLDAIDEKKSLFVVAPTSAGKTFISFYAMRQILRDNDDGVVVYVAPTKALVNQIAAEVQSRFSKSFKADARSVWGIHTRDYRINNPTGCQVLVTVPHILQIMLLAPAHAEKKNSWSYRIKRIIFDEVHCIGQSEDGLIWEQLLLQACCPIIALSATVGNPDEFADWLSSTQKASGHDFVTVQHNTRYSDLRKFIYNPATTFEFSGLPRRQLISAPGLDDAPAFSFVHPVAGLANRSRGLPDDLNLEARDCYTLWQEMSKHQTRDFPVSSALDPEKILPEIVRKLDILKWEDKLKTLLRTWVKDRNSPYDEVVAGLQPSKSERADAKSNGAVVPSPQNKKIASTSVEARLLETTLPLLVDLHANDALPAILFSFDRSICENMAQTILNQLKASEDAWKANDPAWKKKIAGFEKWQKEQEKMSSKTKDVSAKKGKKQGDKDDDDLGGKADRQRDGASEGSSWASFDPAAPVEGYHFADIKKVGQSDLEEYQQQLRYRGIKEWLIEALSRGVGVHHAGMNRKYRQIVEILFRRGFLRVIIATGTLALGINMPCKTVVFSGDSVFLTALNYRQCAGRAGRRGFDVLGNVVFQNMDYSKVCTLLSSRLPDLNGHFPITTSLVLRLAILLNESKGSDFATRSIDAILSQPRLVLGGSEAKTAVLHHLRFSIDYLRRQNLLGRDGAPLNFAGCVSHLYYTESSTWAFHALMKEGYFHKLAKSLRKKPKQTGLTLMLVLAHIFGRHPCKRADEEFYEHYVHRSSSIVFLPDLPTDAKKVLQKHNQETLNIFETYVRTFAEQHLAEQTDDTLPLTKVLFGSSEKEPSSRSRPQIRSPFVTLSGHTDSKFTTINDLCTSVRGGVFLEEAAIPYLPVHDATTDVPLNAYLLDFYKHGDIKALTRANRIKAGDVWFVLNDFSLVLATIVTSLANLMKLSAVGADGDLDVMGTGEALDEARDDLADEQEEKRKAAMKAASQMRAPAAKREKVADSWEDEDMAPSSSATAAQSNAAGGKGQGEDIGDEDGQAVDGKGLMEVLNMFQAVRAEFDAKFKAIWA